MTDEGKNSSKTEIENDSALDDKLSDAGNGEQTGGKCDGPCDKNIQNEVDMLKEELGKKDGQLNEYIELAQRVKAEFDNYRKRVSKEKEQLYVDVKGDIISELLPVIDNMERAVSTEAADADSVLEGVRMVLKQFMDILSKQGLEEIQALGNQFDPAYHNAVMHIEDESYDSNTVAEVFQKGYKLKDKVVRHSMVKVAN